MRRIGCLLALVLFVACSEPAAPPAVEAPDLAPLANLPDCGDEAGERQRGGTCLRSVSGQVVDEVGAPIANLVVTTCAEQCFFGKTGGDGRFTVTINSYLRTERYAVLLHGQPRYAAYYLPLPPPALSRVSIATPLLLLPMPTEGPTILRDGTAQTLQKGAVTLSIDAGTEIYLSPEDASGGEVGLRLRPLRVMAPERLPFLAAVQSPLLVYAFGPFEVVFSKAVRIQIDNDTGLPAGTPLEWLAPRGLQGGRPPPGGLVEVIAPGRVSADGKRLELDGGVRDLTWLIVRRKI